ncbi:MAG: glycosyltransferase [Candidatus Micrarchaeaceae archaeon]
MGTNQAPDSGNGSGRATLSRKITEVAAHTPLKRVVRTAPQTLKSSAESTKKTAVAIKAPGKLTKARRTPEPRVAIVHDWLLGGGAELVVEQLHKLYPDAPIYTSYCTKEWRKRLDGKVRTGFLQYWPFSRLRKYLPFVRAWWFSHLNLKAYDLVISSSGSGEAKGIRPPHTALHINYCHSPTHFCWSRYNEYMDNPGFGAFDWLARFGLKTLIGPFRRWDYKAAQLADYMIANSEHIKAEIQKYYDRSAVVIHPPVTTERFRKLVKAKKRRGFIIAGRQTPYKRFDIAVSACSQLNVPLTVVGDGPEYKRLRKLAGKSVTFLGKVSDDVLAEELASAKGFIFPGVDDFGITPVEAIAAGTPVIAFKAGGALDYVVPGKTGIFFEEQTTKSLAAALRTFSRTKFDAVEVSAHAERFSAHRFAQKMRLFIKRVMAR